MTSPAPYDSDQGGSPPPLQPGYTTTEFWLSLFGVLISFAVAAGWIGPNWSRDHEQLIGAAAQLAVVLIPVGYAIARGITKAGHQRAVGDVLANQAHAQSIRALADVQSQRLSVQRLLRESEAASAANRPDTVPVDVSEPPVPPKRPRTRRV